MIDESYIEWYSVKLEHEYWNRSNPALFKIVPTDHSREIARKYNFLFRQKLNTFYVLVPTGYLAEIVELPKLDFWIQSLDSHLVNYTESTTVDRNSTYLYKITNKGISNNFLTILNSFSKVSEELPTSIFDHYQRDIFLDIFESRKSTELIRNIDSNYDGFYQTDTSKSDGFIFQKEPLKELFGLVIVDSENSSKQEFNIELKSKNVFLKYRVKTEKYQLINLKVEDNSEKPDSIQFESEVTDSEVIFTSKSSVKWQESSEHTFNLMNGKRKPLLENLPTAAHKNLRFLPSKEPYLEIFIHL